MTRRLLVLTALLLCGIVAIRAAAPDAPLRPRIALARLPAAIGSWRAAGDLAIDDESLRVLHADDYVSRLYARGATGVELFVAYYATQRQGDTMHSPMNCLPATGWQPLATTRVEIATTAGAPVTANRLIVQKGLDKDVVFYWYQSHGRTIASEYASKAYLVLDSIRQHRSDAAIVRIVAPVIATENAAAAAATDFVRSLAPLLASHIPD